MRVRNLKVADLHRRETLNPIETIHICARGQIDLLTLDNIDTENLTEASDMPLLRNEGSIGCLKAANIHKDGQVDPGHF